MPGERALVEAAARGDREAFGELVLLHERVAVRTALAALGRQALAKRRVRQRWWQRFVTVAADGDDTERFVARLASGEPGPEQQAVDRSRARETAAAIARLSPKLRDTLLLAASGEHSYDDIGRLLGVATGTVKWRVAEARRLVTQTIEGHRET